MSKNEKPQTKICKHCKTEIPYGAKVCPQCRKKQGMGCLVWVIIIIVALGVIGALAGGGDDSDKSTTDTKPKTESVEKENSEKEEKADETKPEEQNNELTVGSSFEKSGLKITVNESNLDYQDYSDEYGMYAPADGMRYVMVSFTFENGGDSDAYVSIYDFDCYADNTACEQAYLPDDSDFINANLSPGRNISFKTYYSVPINATTIELEYETSIWTGEKAVIKLQ